MDQVSKAAAIAFLQEFIPGYDGISLTNYDNTTEPAIAAGSRIEISQEGYANSIEEAITGWSGIGDGVQAYIYFVPAGATASVIFSTTAPTWNAAKNGWYNGNNRALFSVFRTSSGVYTDKLLLIKQSNPVFSNDIKVNGNSDLGSVLYLKSPNKFNQQSITQDALFDILETYIPNNTDIRNIGLSVRVSATWYVIFLAERIDSTTIDLHGAITSAAGTHESITIDEGNFTSVIITGWV